MSDSRRFLIVQLADIGDLITSTPALAALREAHPTAHIAILTTAHAAPILNGTGLVDDVILFDKHVFDRASALIKPRNALTALKLAARLRRGRYDTTLFFHHFSTRFGAFKFAGLAWSAGSVNRIGLDNGRAGFLTQRLPDGGFGAKHQAQYWLDVVGMVGADSTARPAKIAITPHPVRPKVGIPSPTHSAWTQDNAGRGGDRPRVAIHAGSGGYSHARRWDAERFAAVADRLVETHNAEIVLVGGKGDNSPAVQAAMKHELLDLTGKTTLAELAGVLAACDLFIGADSGVMHTAAASGVPVVAVFGPSNAKAWHPWTPEGRHIVVRSAPECSPCSYVGYGVGARNGCAARTCMHMVTVDQVVEAAETLLKDKPTRDFEPQRHEEHREVIERPHPLPLSVRTSSLGEGGSANAKPKEFPQISMLGMPVSVVTFKEWMAKIGEWMQGDRLHHVCTINPEMIMIARRDPVFQVVLQRADLTVPDGIGLLLAARWKGRQLPERVTGSDGVPMIAAEAAQHGWRLFMLGAAPGVAQQAADVLKQQHPDLQIVGIHVGSPAPDEEDAIVELVNASGADILLVAYGAPEQDKWIARNSPRLKVKMAMGVGGTFDFIAGIIPRAPMAFRRVGMEWLYRLYLQPWRIKRMMRLPVFAALVMMEARK